jgi:hypothetical protein
VTDFNARTFVDTDLQQSLTYCYRITFTHLDDCDRTTIYESPFSNTICPEPCSPPHVLVSGNKAALSSGPIQTYDFSTGALLNSFIPDGAAGLDGRAIAVQGGEIFYTEIVRSDNTTDSIHVCPYGTQGSGGHDSRTPLPNPRPDVGIAGLSFHGGNLYVLTGYSAFNPPLQVYKLNPTTGNVIGGPITIASPPAFASADGFVVLPSGNFLINEGDGEPVYHEFDAATGNLVTGGLQVDVGTFGFAFSTGVALAPDSQSLYFVSAVSLGAPQTLIQTDLSGNLLSLQPIGSDVIEEIAVVAP